jgi:glycosyltransferase involved in cell wall biosynthesis
MIKFSVVIPLYNKESSIINTLNSVFNQDFKPDEIIVVNDGSTDRSVDLIIENFPKKINLISTENLGVSSARNLGISLANNEFITLLDGDDQWLSNHLKNLSELISVYPECSFYGSGYKFQINKGLILNSKLSVGPSYFGELNFFRSYFFGTGLASSSSICIRKSSFHEVDFNVKSARGEDIDVWFRLANFGNFGFSALNTVLINQNNDNKEISKRLVLPPAYFKTLSYYSRSKRSILDKLFCLLILWQHSFTACLLTAVGQRNFFILELDKIIKKDHRILSKLLRVTLLIPESFIVLIRNMRKRFRK